MSRLKLMTILGTRPEIIRLSAIISCCDRYFHQILVHTGQNWDYSLNQVFFQELGLRAPDHCLNVAGGSLGQTMGNIIARSYDLMARLRPDAVLVLGDTNSCLAVLGAKRLHIPIFHMEAGNRCFDARLPEETNRRIVDVTADVNLCYSEQARRYLYDAGLPRDRVFVVGSPMQEVLLPRLEKIHASRILERMGLQAKGYILLSAHREENLDDPESFRGLCASVNAMAEAYQMPVLYSCHPRSKQRFQSSSLSLHPRVVLHEPLGFFDYHKLQTQAYCVVSDSGTLAEESSFYLVQGTPFPAVSLRTSTERPEALERGAMILSGLVPEQVLQAVELAVEMTARGDWGIPVPDYQHERVSAQVVKLIQSYTGIVNRQTWGKGEGAWSVQSPGCW